MATLLQCDTLSVFIVPKLRFFIWAFVKSSFGMRLFAFVLFGGSLFGTLLFVGLSSLWAMLVVNS